MSPALTDTFKGAGIVRLILFFCIHLGATLGAPYYFSSAGIITLFWPATGIALAATLAGGYPYAIATLLSCAVAGWLTPEKGIAQAFFSAANALEIFIARYWLLRIGRIDIGFDKATDYMKFVVYAGILLPIPSALIAAAAIVSFTQTQMPFWFHAREWWMSDSLGILALTPLLLIWRSLPPGWFSPRHIVEAVAGVGLTAVAGYFLLGSSSENASAYPHGFLFFIFVAWAATRFGRHATLLITSMVIAIVLAGARSQGKTSEISALNFLNIWLFLVTLSTVGMALATVFNERRVALRKNAELVAAYRREESRRRESDQALKKTSIDFQRLVETAEEGVWTINTKGETTFANLRMAEMLGYRPIEMVGKNFLDFMPETDRKTGASRLAQRNAGRGEAHECVLVHRNGTPVWTYMQTSAMTDIEGNVTGALAMVTDVTHGKRTERAYAELKDRYTKLIEGIHDAIIIHQSGIVVAANAATVRLIGAPNAESLIGRNALNFVHPDDHAMVIERLRKINQPGASAPPIKERFIRFDQSVIEVEVKGSAILYEGRLATMVIMREILKS